MDQIRLDGWLPALVTPLTPQRDVDEDDLATLVHRALRAGAAGVLVAGSTGEGALLEPAQRHAVTRAARAAVDAAGTRPGGRSVEAGEARPLVLAGASGPTPAALADDVERLAAAGADLVLVLAPATYTLTPEELVDLHVGVADAAPVPTLAYHIPQLTGSSLTPEAVRELAVHPGVAGMKDSSPDAERRAAFAAATADRDFAVLTGHAPTLADALGAGVAGSITAIANVRQRQVGALHAAVRQGDTRAVEHRQAELARTSAALSSVGPSLPAVLKAALQLDGILRERWCRPPLRSVDPGRLDHVRTALLA